MAKVEIETWLFLLQKNKQADKITETNFLDTELKITLEKR